MSDMSPKTYARVAGALMLISLFAGTFGEMYVPSRMIVPDDAAATAHNIAAAHGLFRLGFASYLLEAICDIALSFLFYALLRPVNDGLALLSAFFGLVSTTLYGVAEMFYFSALIVVSGGNYLKSFSPAQQDALALLSLRAFGVVAGLFMALYGIATVLRGYLIVRSSYLPSTLGFLLIAGGAGFIIENLALVLAPSYASPLFFLPMLVAAFPLMTWLLVKGVDVERWAQTALVSTASRECT